MEYNNTQILHDAIIQKQLQPSDVELILKEYPSSISSINNYNCLPLHSAFYCNQSDEVIKYLIQVYPESVRIVDNKGCLPVARASLLCRAQLVTFIADLYIEGLMVPSCDDSLPIHICCQSVQRNIKLYLRMQNVITNLAMKCPSSLMVEDASGNLPIHYLCQDYNCENIIPILVELCPNSLAMSDSDGALAIHLACQFGLSVDTILYLANKNPFGLSKVCGFARLPMYYALHIYRGDKQSQIVRTFLRLNPESCVEPSLLRDSKRIHRQEFLDFAMAQCKRSGGQTYRILLNSSNPDSLPNRIHFDNYCEMNWRPRSAAIYAILALSI